jgi:hypothetical protein
VESFGSISLSLLGWSAATLTGLSPLWQPNPPSIALRFLAGDARIFSQAPARSIELVFEPCELTGSGGIAGDQIVNPSGWKRS